MYFGVCGFVACYDDYRKISNISGTKLQNLNDCRLVLQLTFANPFKPCFKLRMKM